MDSPEDLRLFEIFHIKCLPTIPGYTKTKLWPLIPQLSTTEPAIRHAVLAIASLYEETEFLGKPINDNPRISEDRRVSKSETVALKHYTKALNELQQGLSSKASSPAIVLIACLLFTCMEALRGQDEAALAHIENGINITTNLKEKQESETTSGQSSFILSQNSQFSESLSSAFSRLRLLSFSIKEQTAPEQSKTLPRVLADYPPHSSFSTLAEARMGLERIMNNAADIVYGPPQCRCPNTTSPGPDPAVTSRIRVDAQIKHWSRAFDSFMTKALPQGEYKDNSIVEHRKTYPLILRTLAKNVSIRLWVSYLPEGDPSLDSMIPDFEELLDLAERCTVSQGQDHTTIPGNIFRPPLFIMDIGIIPAIFFVACKCPSMALRLRAIEMLERTPRREVLWSSTSAGQKARNLLELEMSRQVCT